MNQITASASAQVNEVLRQFAPNLATSECEMKQLGEGCQASVFAVRPREGQATWESQSDLIVKIYKPTELRSLDLVDRQFQALSQLYEALHHTNIDGWKISVPQPLFRCAQPIALTMTKVSGIALTSLLDTDDGLPAQLQDSFARTVAVALDRFWTTQSQMYGDLNFRNILCDCPARVISFVDVGMLESAYFCPGVPEDWNPASRDLAYMLYDVGVDVKRTILNSRARHRYHRIAESIVSAYMERVKTEPEKHQLLDEIRACVDVHLKLLPSSSSVRWLWQRILQVIASRYVDTMVKTLRPAGPVPEPHVKVRSFAASAEQASDLERSRGTVQGPSTYFTTSWDDGFPLDLRVADLLAKYGLSGTFYVPLTAECPTMTAAEIRGLNSAFELGAHTLHHVDLTAQTDQQAWEEISGSKAWIEDVTGGPCPMFCPPKGRFHARHLDLIRQAGFLGARTVELLSLGSPRPKAGVLVMPTTVQAHPHGLPAYARNVIKRGAIGSLWNYVARGRSIDWRKLAESLLRCSLQQGGVFHLWGHSWELEENGQWQRLEEVLRLMSQFASQAAALTNTQICERFLPGANEALVYPAMIERGAAPRVEINPGAVGSSLR
jgi:peptidoglycan/xylan/chitin deacetylase (PgdA/CDA1 family)